MGQRLNARSVTLIAADAMTRVGHNESYESISGRGFPLNDARVTIFDLRSDDRPLSNPLIGLYDWYKACLEDLD